MSGEFGMKWVPLLVVLALLAVLLLVNRQIHVRTGHRLLEKNIQSDIGAGIAFFLLLGTLEYAFGRSPLRAFVVSAIGGVGFSIISNWEHRRRAKSQW
jgi:hypothetical protein